MDDDVLANCGLSQFIFNSCTHNQDAGVFCYGRSLCNDGEIRLFDGENIYQREGRVEMCLNGVWGTVCADGWDEVATSIVCTQLGYENGLLLRYSQNTITPIVFHNIICNETHSMLFQCVNLHSIGVYNCEGNSIAGVVYLNTNSLHNATLSSNTTETPTSVTVAGLSKTYIAILSGSLGSAILVIIGISIVSIITIVYIQRMKIKRSKRNSAITDVPMQDNEAYATLSASHHVETQPNEAYGTLVL